MNPISVAVAFAIIWMCVFFIVLPIGIRGRWESEDDGVEGAESGAPSNPRLALRVAVTTGITVALTAVFVVAAQAGLFDPQNWPSFDLYNPTPGEEGTARLP
jgi:predicted secreted protein